jgi:TPP-dependent pyruvate/acetoin dehydrogenase alpha subunit
VLKPLSFQQLRGIKGREIHRLFHISVERCGQLSTVRITAVTPICSGVIYNQPFNQPSSFARQEKTVTMAGKVGQTTAGAAVSTGGSLISDGKLKQLYATMVQCRMLTERACRLRGRPLLRSLYAASMGQEAIATGSAIDLQPDDTIALAPHNSIAALVKVLVEGVPLDGIVAQMDQDRSAYGQSHNIIMPCPTQGTQIDLATSVALVNKRKKKNNVVVAFGDKSTTTLGGWHQALRLATNKSLPIIFVVEDNPWPSPKPGPANFKAGNEEKDSTAEFNPSGKAGGKAQSDGLPIITVDANDVVAVYRVAYESVQRVRQGGGPVLVEGKQYRLHSPTKRRVANSVSSRNGRDPLIHMERYLKTKGLFTPRWKDQLVDEFSRKLDASVGAAQKARRIPQQ